MVKQLNRTDMEVLKTETNSPYRTDLIKLDVPVLGGNYAVIAYRDGIEFNRKDGLILDAANETFKASVSGMAQVVFNSQFTNF